MIVPAVSYQSWVFIGIGLMSSPVYFFFYRLFEMFPVLCRKLPPVVGQPKNMSELVYGCVFGAGV